MNDWKMLGGIIFTVIFFYFCQTMNFPVAWLWLPVLVVMVFYFQEGFWKIETLQWIHLLLAFYAIWVLLSFLCHYFALSMLNPNSYITVHRNQIGWGISFLFEFTQRYLFAPVLFLSGIYFFSGRNRYRHICWLPLLFVPSMGVAVYQGLIDKSFLNPNGLEICGLSRDASAFGISLFLLIPLCLVGLITFSNPWRKAIFGSVAGLILFCVLLRGQRTTLLGIMAFGIFWHFIRCWVYRLPVFRISSKLILYIFLIIFFFGSIFVLGDRLDKKKSLYLIHEIKNNIYDLNAYGVGFLYRRKIEARIIKARIAAKLTLLSPISGWGPGGFIRNMNNIRFIEGKKPIPIHNAANHYLQMSSDMGIMGALMNFSLLLAPIIYAFKNGKSVQGINNRWHLAILCSTLMIFLFLFLSGPHTLSLDVLFILSAISGSILTDLNGAGGSFAKIHFWKWLFIFSGFTLFFLYGVYDNSFGKNGYIARQKAPWWPLKNQYGLYPEEKLNGNRMQWTAKETVQRRKATSNIIGFKIIAFPYNIERDKGLVVELQVNDTIAGDYHFFHPGPRYMYYYFPKMAKTEVEIRTAVNRTFNPSELGINRDNRNLGIAMGPIRFLRIMPAEGVGFYDWETGNSNPIAEWPRHVPLRFRWTNIQASLNLTDHTDETATLYLMCAHPDMDKKPVVVHVLSGNTISVKEVFKDNGWRRINLTLKEIDSEIVTIRVNRTWNPKFFGVSGDTRNLGVAVAIPEGQ